MRHGLSSYFNQIRNYNLSALIMITGRNNSGELIQRVISPARWVCCRGSMLPTRAKHVCLSPRHNVIFNFFFQWDSVTVLICFNRISQRNCSSNRTERDNTEVHKIYWRANGTNSQFPTWLLTVGLRLAPFSPLPNHANPCSRLTGKRHWQRLRLKGQELKLAPKICYIIL